MPAVESLFSAPLLGEVDTKHSSLRSGTDEDFQHSVIPSSDEQNLYRIRAIRSGISPEG